MKRFIAKLSLLFFLAIFWLSPLTGSSYYDTETSTGNTFSATCWGAPDKPTQINPSEYVNINDIDFQWSATTNHCPLPVDTWYNFQIASVSDFSVILQESGDIQNITNFSVTGLAAGEYWWRVQVKDQYYYSDVSAAFLLIIDQTNPIISGVTHLIATPEESNDKKATISWTTDELSTSNFKYRSSSGSWIDITDDLSANNTSHSRTFNISENETYYYEIISTDQAGNTTITSLGKTFNTGDLDDVADVDPTTDIVINEFLPNPTGDDFAPYPGGEWVEIYNRGSIDYDLTGWSIGAYNTPSDRLYFNPGINTFSSDGINDLNISPGEFMVVYRNGDSTFYMKNTADDRIRLFNASDVRVDRYMYTASQVIENKSIARYPDGSDTWFDPIPSPLGANVLEDWQLKQPEINYTFDGQKLSFEVTNVDKFNQIEYQLTYNSDSGEQGVIGTSQLINNQTSYKKDEIIFGTCSTGGTCTYHQNPKDINLKIILNGESEVINLEKVIQ